jgi:hypothetical protein
MSEIPTYSAERNIVTVIEEPTEVVVSVSGLQGARGSTFISGNGDPSADLGITGDIYVDLTGNAFWGPKTESGWGLGPFYVPGAVSRFVFTQGLPSDEWVIDHSLGGRPSVTIVDSASTTVIGEVSYVNDSRVIVRFTSPFSGFAYLT